MAGKSRGPRKPWKPGDPLPDKRDMGKGKGVGSGKPTAASMLAPVIPSDYPEKYDPTGAVEFVKDPYGARPIPVITEYGCSLIEKYVRQGLAQSSIARNLRLGRSQFGDCKKRQLEVREAFEMGKGFLEDHCTDLFLKQAERGNVIALIYLTKARLGWRDNDPPPAATSNVTIHLPASMSLEDLKRLSASGVTPMQLQQANPLAIPEESVVDTEGEES